MPKKHKRKLLEGGDHSQKRVQLKSSNDSTISDQHSSNLCNIRPEVKENVDRSRHLYQKGESNEWLQVFDQPFKCAVIDELVIEGDHFLHPLQQEIERHVRFHEKHNDLYRFKQSDDLKLMSHLSYCDAITRCLRQQLLPILAQATDIELFEDQIDITVSKYDRNDVLLCHDDLLEERRIAFIWYLVPSDWSSADAGELLLFSRDGNAPLTTTPKLHHIR